jgi:hypothetical protein
MRNIKFKYESHYVIFFTQYKGVDVELLRAKLQDGTYQELKRLQNLAQGQLLELNAALQLQNAA